MQYEDCHIWISLSWCMGGARRALRRFADEGSSSADAGGL